jgi:hypothetical protein
VKTVLQVHSESLSEKYPGMPTDVGRSRNGAFKYLKDRIWKRIQGWIEKLLLAGERCVNKISSTSHSYFLHGVFQTSSRSVSSYQCSHPQVLVGEPRRRKKNKLGVLEGDVQTQAYGGPRFLRYRVV